MPFSRKSTTALTRLETVKMMFNKEIPDMIVSSTSSCGQPEKVTDAIEVEQESVPVEGDNKI